MSEAVQYMIGNILGVLIVGIIIFFLIKFLFRYPARNFLAAKICFALFCLGGLWKVARFFQQTGGVYYSDIEDLFWGIAFVLGSAVGYFYGWKKRS